MAPRTAPRSPRRVAEHPTAAPPSEAELPAAGIVPIGSEPPQLGDGFLTDVDVAAAFQVEPRTIKLWRRTRGLPYIALTNKVVRFRRDDIEKWAAKRVRRVVV